MAYSWQSKNQSQNGVEDMVLLSKVTDDQITDNLKKRINADLMFTYIEQYNGVASHEQPPHIYAVADHMFQSMITDEENQCVIISGESGAGKTESAKLIMNYIAAVSSRGGSSANVVDNIKRIILESNPLLESFGNAKTLRNNNSSRFGKYFEINFSKSGAPAGGKISNFLLEKVRAAYGIADCVSADSIDQSRVVGPGQGERNFHIFYQLTKACSAEEKESLGMMEPKFFHYLNQSTEYSADGINDAEEYADMKNGMKVCSISPADQTSILQILAGILHLGNIHFAEEGNDAKVADPETLAFPAYLLGVSEDTLRAKLTSRVMTTGGFGKRGSAYNVPMNVQQANGTRDALAKSLYSRMFDWIVQAVNSALAQLSFGDQRLCIGVLDIFGFEIFDKNGFEQFCINYVNEKLQQIFIELTLKSEQEEYLKEGIQWTPIDYFNNKIVVDLIESKKPPGVMAVLDDVCSTMHAQVDGADVKFVQHYKGLQTQFIISHYAGSVTYDCEGFTDSNKDTLFKDLVQLMKSTSNHFIAALFPEDVQDDDRKRPTTVSYKIKVVPSLCIKPNETKRPKDWDNKRNFFEKFLRRFAILTKETWPSWTGNPHDGIKFIMQSVDMDSKEWQIGKSKVFIKSPESLFLLEEQRDRKFHGYAKVIQRAYRRWKSRKYFLELRKKAAVVVYQKKERKRFSLNREFLGDYLSYLDNPILKALVGKNEKVFFADTVQKYDRKFKPTSREFLITENSIILIGAEKEKNGPNKGKFVKTIKRKLSFKELSAVSLSTLSDDMFVLHIPSEYDNVLENLFKTELITVLSEKYQLATGRSLTINFTDSIKYTVKKTTWQSGGTLEIKFIVDAACKIPTIKQAGKATEVRVAPGLPKDSQPKASTLMQRQPQKSSNTVKTSNPNQNSYRPPQQKQPSPVVSPASTSPAALRAANSHKAAEGIASNRIVPSPAALKKKAPPPVPPPKKLPQCKALYDYDATEADELSFKVGDIITIVSKDDEGWWTGNLRGKKGLFPAN
ncbi:Unconventional myosin-Ie, partial [Irineochytrium annulatum]